MDEKGRAQACRWCLVLIFFGVACRTRVESTGPVRLVDLSANSEASSGFRAEEIEGDEFESGTEGWEGVSAAVQVHVEEGHLIATYVPNRVREVDPASLPPLPTLISKAVTLDARRVNCLGLRLRLPETKHTPRVFWRRVGDSDFAHERSLPLTSIRPGSFFVNRVVLSEHECWSGTISHLGLLLSRVEGRVELDRIAFEWMGVESRIAQQHPGGKVPKVRLGSVVKESVILSPGEEREFEVSIPSRGRFTASLGWVGRPVFEADEKVEVGVRLLVGKETMVLPGACEVKSGEPGAWRRFGYDVSKYAGKKAKIQLFARGAEKEDWAGVFGAPCLTTEPAAGMNVVLISLDTLRADHLGAYGYPKETSPALDGLAAGGVRFHDAMSTAPATLASHMSVMTSRWPSVHGVVGNRDRLSEEIETLAERVRSGGWRTFAAVEDSYVAADFGFHFGFESYDDGPRGVEVHPDRARSTFGRATELLDELASERFFLFVHTYGPHTPYNAPESVAQRFCGPEYRGSVTSGFDQNDARRLCAEGRPRDADLREVEARYDAGVRATDRALGEFLSRLDDLELRDETVVVVFSDHGEEFLDHGLSLATHGYSLYQELVHVPLIIRAPGKLPAGSVVREPVSLVDVYPTVLRLLGLPSSPEIQGLDLVDLVGGGAPQADRILFAQELRFSRQTAARWGRFKFIQTGRVEEATRLLFGRESPELRRYLESETKELFDLIADPGEKSNRWSEHSEEARRLERRAEGLLELGDVLRAGREAEEGSQPLLKDDVRSRLEALGYLRAEGEEDGE